MSKRATLRVLWFTHIPADAVNRHLGRPTTGTGFWIHSLIQPLVDSGQVELGIVTATAGDPAFQFRDGSVDYFNIPQQKYAEVFNVLPNWRLTRYLRRAAEIVESWKPDLIHVHGTERFFALVRARGLVHVPTVVSIQHVLSQLDRFSWGEMGLRDVVRNTTLREISRNATLFTEARRFERQLVNEGQILNGVQGALGRTDWDRAHVRRINPRLPYFHVEEMMRPQFVDSMPWSIDNVRRHSLMTTSGGSPIKGLPVLIRAVAVLRDWGYDVKLKVAGLSSKNPWRAHERWTLKLLRQLKLENSVELLGWCGPDALIEHQLRSHCFVTPSYSENGCNALSEAQLVGLPCVASHSGGLTTTIEDEQTGLLFSVGDEAMLARQVERVFLDDKLATSLGSQARRRSRLRHDPTAVVQSLISAYDQTIKAAGIGALEAVEQ